MLLDRRLVDRHKVVVEEVVGRARLGELVGGRRVRRSLGRVFGRVLGGLLVLSAIEMFITRWPTLEGLKEAAEALNDGARPGADAVAHFDDCIVLVNDSVVPADGRC